MKPPPLDQDAEKEAATRHQMQTHNQQINNIQLHRNKRKTHSRNTKNTYTTKNPGHVQDTHITPKEKPEI